MLLEGIPDEYVVADPRLQRSEYVDGVVHLMAQLADALSHAHGQGIYHHDLKPSNVLLSPSGCPLLLDFNLSEDTEVGPTMFGGTLPYMPPEQLKKVILGPDSETTPVDASWDVYSLGAILFELLTGTLPFGEYPPGTPENVAAADLAESQKRGYLSARLKNPAVSIQLDRLIEKCLQLDAKDRPRSALELAEQLRAQLAPVQKLKRWMHRRRWLIGSATATAVLMLAVVAAVLLNRAPLEVRSYEAGVNAFKNDRFGQAKEYFSEAHRASPNLYEPLIASAQAKVALGDFEEACEDLDKVCRLRPTGLSYAWWAYCQQLCGKRVPATINYQEAMNRGFVAPVICNNLGILSYHKGALVRAIQFFDQAIQLDSSCQIVYHNRAIAHHTYAQRNIADRESHGADALADISAAVEIGSPSARLLYDAARLNAAYNNAPQKNRIVSVFIKRAIDSGLGVATIRKSHELQPYLDDLISGKTATAGTAVSDTEDIRVLAPPHFFPSLPQRKS